jgi:hypothetical protein
MYRDYDTLKAWVSSKNLQKRIDQLAKKYKNKKVLVYGAGILASVIFENYNLSALEIVGFADQKFFTTDETFHNIKAVSPYDIGELKPEIILLATYNTGNIKNFIKEEVLASLGKVPVEPIVKKNLREKITEFLED